MCLFSLLLLQQPLVTKPFILSLLEMDLTIDGHDLTPHWARYRHLAAHQPFILLLCLVRRQLHSRIQLLMARPKLRLQQLRKVNNVMDKPAQTITSTSNTKIKQVIKLRKRSHRDSAGLMIIEGCTELQHALNNKHQLTEIFFCPELFRDHVESDILSQCQKNGINLIECTIPVFQKISYRERPNGLLALAPQIQSSLDQLQIKDNMLIVIAEAIEKPGNLGTILRSADASGADAVIICDRCTDINNPNVIRASIGTIFTIPVIETESAEAITWLKQNNIQILAATPQATQLHTDTDMSGNIAIAVGAEKPGLSDIWFNAADIKVRIPMLGQADSLNVAASTTILLYEALRQRTC